MHYGFTKSKGGKEDVQHAADQQYSRSEQKWIWDRKAQLAVITAYVLRSEKMPTTIHIDGFADQHPEKTRCVVSRGQEADFWIWGVLKNGRSFGVLRSGVAMDPGYYEYKAAFVDQDGICRQSTLLDKHYSQKQPDVMLAMPGKERLLWLIDGALFCWEGLEGKYAVRINNRLPEETTITDAVIKENGFLELICSGGARYGYISGADAVLEPMEEGWLAHANGDCCDGWNNDLQACMMQEAIPWGLSIDEGVTAVEGYCFSGCNLRKLYLPQSLERICSEAFSDNQALERVVIPKSVTAVEDKAFGGCAGLQELRIEGPLDRLSLWDETAFSDCPCEAAYMKMRAVGSNLNNIDE